MRIVFFGTSRFAAGVLSYLIEKKQVEIAAIVTRPDRPQGRSLRLSHSPVKEEAVKLLPNVPLFQPEKASIDEFATVLGSFDADLFVVVAYGEIIKHNILTLPRLCCINIHASLLPKYRGAAPIQRCLMAGEKETGITIIEMVRAMDAGPMIERVKVAIPETMTFGELEPKLLEAACIGLSNAIRAFEENRVVKEVQKEEAATYAAKLMPSDEKIDWNHPAVTLHNLIRALSPTPSAWCMIRIGNEEKRLKIKRSLVRRDLQPGKPREIILAGKDALVVSCGKETLQLLEVQLEGKKSMPVPDFLRGLSNTSFSIVE